LTSRAIDVCLSHLSLSEDSALRRLPRQPKRARDTKFLDNFDDKTLYFDCFWHHANSDRIWLIGPAPTNLKNHYKRATYTALPSGKQLRAKHNFSLSVMATSLFDVPAGTTAISIEFDGQIYVADVQPSLASDFVGENLLFTLSKNNDLAWIKCWADYHVRHHDISSIVFFDNGSSAYDCAAIENVLTDIKGLKKFSVISVPFPYGYKDEALKVNPYWPQFLQVACMSIVLRRFGAVANSITNLDIDELAVSDEPICNLAKTSDIGILAMKGGWVEPIADDGADLVDHRSYSSIQKDEKKSQVTAGKWVIDPARKWLEKPSVFPYMHWIEGRPLFGKRYFGNAHFLHFKAINTGWKVNRQKPKDFDEDLYEKRQIKW